MKKQLATSSHSSCGPSHGQRLIACCLLLIVVFLVVNPLCECRDHMDNLRHFSAHGFLIILLLVACAGITLTKALRWIELGSFGLLQVLPPSSSVTREASDRFAGLFRCELPLPLRI